MPCESLTHTCDMCWVALTLEHPRNLIPSLCKQFYDLGWVTGTGGGISIKPGGYVINNGNDERWVGGGGAEWVKLRNKRGAGAASGSQTPHSTTRHHTPQPDTHHNSQPDTTLHSQTHTTLHSQTHTTLHSQTPHFTARHHTSQPDTTPHSQTPHFTVRHHTSQPDTRLFTAKHHTSQPVTHYTSQPDTHFTARHSPHFTARHHTSQPETHHTSQPDTHVTASHHTSQPDTHHTSQPDTTLHSQTPHFTARLTMNAGILYVAEEFHCFRRQVGSIKFQRFGRSSEVLEEGGLSNPIYDYGSGSGFTALQEIEPPSFEKHEPKKYQSAHAMKLQNAALSLDNPLYQENSDA
ncbi:hypothetical protein Btru_018324 [Bulinus truncatus]|nr:hypothetical protein Btru_018324 [Bulinus truncatus]